MDVQFRLAAATAVRSRIARAILSDPTPAARIGSVHLQSHQASAVSRLVESIGQFRGALLCDEVGMGKTYVGLAVAARFGRCAVVAPAALMSMWRDALTATGVSADLLSFESLSRIRVSTRGARTNGDHFEIVVIDEAHHARNPATNRYLALSALVRGARVLLLTATPIHNRRKDLVALLSLFLGDRAHRLTAAELSLCVVRREQRQIEGASRIPPVIGPISHALPDRPGFVERILRLPPPVPVRDGGVAGILVARSLVHQWASSDAAFREALKRRIARAAALSSSLECGRYPSASELETWVYGDGALQLGFSELLASPVGNNIELLAAVRAHLDALDEIRSEFGAGSIDDHRAGVLAEIVAAHPGATIVAFAQYSETVSMLYRRLSRTARAALLTSHGARVAGGALQRDEAIHRFAPLANHRPPPAAAEKIELLLTTDLLSEGVNLQDASVVVHLDIPWTVARMEQRVGRVARIGSPHDRVHVHLLRPPASAAATLDADEILSRKWRIASRVVGTSAPNPTSDCVNPEPSVANDVLPSPAKPQTPGSADEQSQSLSARTERLRSILSRWMLPGSAQSEDCLLAAVHSPRPGFLAVVQLAGRTYLLVKDGESLSANIDAQLTVARRVTDSEVAIDVANAKAAFAAIVDWCASESASTAAGIASSSAMVRRQITVRIDLAIQTALPHQRARRSLLAARARRVATTQQCAAVERELQALAHSPLSPDEWLETIATLADPDAQAGGTDRSSGQCRPLALLLLVQPLTDSSP